VFQGAALSRFRPLVANVAVAVAAIAVSLVMVEGLVRLFGLAPVIPAGPERGLKSLLTFDQTLQTRYLPKATTRITSPQGEFDVFYRTNELGLRGAEVPPKAANEKRVLAVGNSFVEGWGVKEDEAFVSVAQAAANKQQTNPGASKITVVNAGISGYGAAQVYLNTKRIWSATNPDLVLMVLVGTMVSADQQYLRLAHKDSHGIAQGLSADAVLNGGVSETEAVKSRPVAPWIESLSRISATVRLIRNRLANEAEINRIKIGDPETDMLAAYRSDAASLQTMLQPTLQHVAALADWTRQRGAKFTLLYLPMAFQLSPDAWDQGRKAYRLSATRNDDGDIGFIKTFCTDQHLDCLFANDLLHKAIEEQGARKIFYSYDFHMTPEGNRIVGTWLGNDLVKILNGN
jgi:hypothetical protein